VRTRFLSHSLWHILPFCDDALKVQLAGMIELNPAVSLDVIDVKHATLPPAD
jgi:hypothetical protein